MKETASGGAEMNYPNLNLDFFCIFYLLLKCWGQYSFLSWICAKTSDIQMQEVQAPGADSSSQGNACILSSFVRIKSEAAWGNGEGKSWSLREHLRASRLCSLVPCSSSRTEGVPPTCPLSFPFTVVPLQGVTAPLDPAQVWHRGRCGQDVSASLWSVFSLLRLYLPGFLG